MVEVTDLSSYLLLYIILTMFTMYNILTLCILKNSHQNTRLDVTLQLFEDSLPASQPIFFEYRPVDVVNIGCSKDLAVSSQSRPDRNTHQMYVLCIRAINKPCSEETLHTLYTLITLLKSLSQAIFLSSFTCTSLYSFHSLTYSFRVPHPTPFQEFF